MKRVVGAGLAAATLDDLIERGSDEVITVAAFYSHQPTDEDVSGLEQEVQPRALGDTIRMAFANGIVVVRAAANGGPNSATIAGPNPEGGLLLVSNSDDRMTVTRDDSLTHLRR